MALILTRRRDEKIVVVDSAGNVILEIWPVDIRGEQVRIALEGERKYSIHRKEVYEEMKKAGKGFDPKAGPNPEIIKKA